MKIAKTGAFNALIETIQLFNLSEEDGDKLFHKLANEYQEARPRTVTPYVDRVYIVKCSIHGEDTIGLGLPLELGESEGVWKYMHLYPHSTPWEVQKIYQMTDLEVVDVIAELKGDVGQTRPRVNSPALTSDEVNWVANFFRVQGV